MERHLQRDKIIMVVDDQEENFRFIEASLRKIPAQIVWAKNGEEAVKLCGKLPTIDLVLMDVTMPVMNGYEATRLIREVRKDIPIFVQTYYKTVYDADRRMSINFEGLVQKPLKLDDVYGVVNNFLTK